MSILDDILFANPELSLLKADGYDEAVIGICFGDVPRLIYSVSKIIAIIMAEMEDEDEDPDYDHYTIAREHFDFNIGGAYVGEQTPIYQEDEMMELI